MNWRTGPLASQTYFMLKPLLGYPRVRWYDAGWTEWAARRDLPVANDGAAGKTAR
jgi:thiosulfate/3-mercaptopyruvate sulfurtransferase